MDLSQQLGLPFIGGTIANPVVLLKDPRSLLKVVESVGIRKLLGVVEDSRNQVLLLCLSRMFLSQFRVVLPHQSAGRHPPRPVVDAGEDIFELVDDG